METQTSIKRMYRSSMSGHYARVLYELNVPKTDIEKTKEAFAEVPQLREVFINPTISAKIKMSVIDQVFPESMKNFLKVVCKNQRVNLINEIFDAYDEYCDEQAHILTAVLACVGFILKTGDDEYDWSLKGRLTRLEQKLTWR